MKMLITRPSQILLTVFFPLWCLHQSHSDFFAPWWHFPCAPSLHLGQITLPSVHIDATLTSLDPTEALEPVVHPRERLSSLNYSPSLQEIQVALLPEINISIDQAHVPGPHFHLEEFARSACHSAWFLGGLRYRRKHLELNWKKVRDKAGMDHVCSDLYELQTYCVPGIVPDTFRSLCHLFFPVWGSELQEITPSQLHSQEAACLGHHAQGGSTP